MTARMAEALGGEVLWTPTPASVRASRVGRYLEWLEAERGLTLSSYDALWRWSVEDLPGFWRSIWDHFDVVADGCPDTVLADRQMPGARWFPDVRLNYAENMLRGPADQVVVVAVSQTRAPIRLSRGELRDAVARAAEGLRRLGVGKGDRVAGYVPNIPEALVALLATASLGAVWAACAPELGTPSVLDRLRQIEPKVLIAVDGYRHGDRDNDRREDVDVITGALPSLVETVRIPYLYAARDDTLTWDQLTGHDAELTFERLPFDTPLWILFSSGTTGLPKAIAHSHGGIVLESMKSLALQVDLGADDSYFVFCTTSWVMWNIQVSALLVGAAAVLMDGNPTYPDGAQLWRVIEQTGTTVFGCGAAFLMGWRRQDLAPGRMFDLSRLRGLTSTGSPLPAEGFRWVYDAVSPTVFLQSASGGTDVCTTFVGGSPLLPVRAGEIAGRSLGVDVAALDAQGNSVVDRLGELVISAPMPSMPVFFWNDPDGERYRASYFEVYPGRWRHGDWAMFNERGGCAITGRSDGTLNRGGVRLGTSEFYAVLEEMPEIADSLVVHLEDDSGGVGRLLLFVQTAAEAQLDDLLRRRIVHELRRRLSPRHGPDEILAVPGIPYNLTGKKLEVPVKRMLQGAARGSVVSDGAVREPRTLDAFERLAAGFASTPATPPTAAADRSEW